MGATSDAELLARAVRNPGRLALDVTDLTIPFPFGGKSLGFTEEMNLVWSFRYHETRDPSSGRVVEVGRAMVEFPDFVCVAQGIPWDEDLLAGVYTLTTTLGLGIYKEARIEGTQIPAVVPAWPRLVFAAEDPKGKSVLFRRPIPRLVARSIALAKTRRAGLPVRFTPTPTSDRTTQDYQVARLENLIL